ncbi:MAG: hypothetical protein L6V95_09060 [Candidatus Melainabacteria bacterium]|nr:MAG: hypothetical protein L6V95_09060 [Candidatus Melainabacteria bacterium]
MNTIGYNASRNFNKSLNQNIQNASINPSLFKCASINNQNDVYETAKVTPFQKAKFFLTDFFPLVCQIQNAKTKFHLL